MLDLHLTKVLRKASKQVHEQQCSIHGNPLAELCLVKNYPTFFPLYTLYRDHDVQRHNVQY